MDNIVISQSSAEIRRQTVVSARRVTHAAENTDESHRRRHRDAFCNRMTVVIVVECSRVSRSGRREDALSAR
jgi:hypothetical protein